MLLWKVSLQVSPPYLSIFINVYCWHKCKGVLCDIKMLYFVLLYFSAFCVCVWTALGTDCLEYDVDLIWWCWIHPPPNFFKRSNALSSLQSQKIQITIPKVFQTPTLGWRIWGLVYHVVDEVLIYSRITLKHVLHIFDTLLNASYALPKLWV